MLLGKSGPSRAPNCLSPQGSDLPTPPGDSERHGHFVRFGRHSRSASMSGTHKSLIVTFIMCLGLWGCARGPVSTAAAERMKVLEYKVARLEDNLQTAAAARDELDKKLALAEQERGRLLGEIAKLKVVI